MMGKKRGQVTIFVILAILIIVAIALLFFLFRNQIDPTPANVLKNTPDEFEDCVNVHVGRAVDLIFENSGYVEPSSFTYTTRNIEGYYKQWPIEEVPYLCYTGMNYARCISQIPFFTNHLEEEIFNYVEPKVEGCFESLEQSLKDNAFSVSVGNTENLKVDLIDNVVEVSVDKELTQEHSGEEQRFESFTARYRTPLYRIAQVTERIIDEEIKWCNSDYIEIMGAYPNFKVDKFQTGDGIKIYRVEEISTGKKWAFAIRNCVLSVPS